MEDTPKDAPLGDEEKSLRMDCLRQAARIPSKVNGGRPHPMTAEDIILAAQKMYNWVSTSKR